MNVLAAAAAASMAYGTREKGNANPRLDAGWIIFGENGGVSQPALAAAAFLRQWPDQRGDAAAIHVRRTLKCAVPPVGHREAAAWKVFATSLNALDAADKAEAADRAAAARREEERGPTARSSEDLTYAPPEKKNELSDLGRASGGRKSPGPDRGERRTGQK